MIEMLNNRVLKIARREPHSSILGNWREILIGPDTHTAYNKFKFALFCIQLNKFDFDRKYLF